MKDLFTVDRRIIFAILFVSMVIGPGFAPISGFAGDQAESCLPHQPIMIFEDHGLWGFTWTNPLTGDKEYRPGSGVKKGDGSIEDPFVISGWCIETFNPINSREWAGILIRGTTTHAAIGENFVFGGVGGHGIFVSGAENLSILTNSIQLVPGHGVYVEDSALIEVTGNTISRGNGNGLRLQEVRDSVISSNSIENVDHNAIQLTSSKGIIVEENTVRNSGHSLAVACGLHLEQ